MVERYLIKRLSSFKRKGSKLKDYKGIILAGGKGTRLYPSTLSVSKQLLPIFDKPMIYYPLSTLMMARIKDILVISSPKDLPLYESLLGDGSKLGIQISYKEQPEPKGIAEAFTLGKDFIGNSNVCLILGDNIFYGYDFSKLLTNSVRKNKFGATVFGYEVSNPSEFGVIEFDKKGKAVSIQEKPKNPKSSYALVGLYIYDNEVVKISERLQPSSRGELEISDVNIEYLKKNKLDVVTLKRSFAWLDTGTHESLLEASQYVSTIEKRQGIKIGCLEEVAYQNQWISKKELLKIVNELGDTHYSKYLRKISKLK